MTLLFGFIEDFSVFPYNNAIVRKRVNCERLLTVKRRPIVWSKDFQIAVVAVVTSVSAPVITLIITIFPSLASDVPMVVGVNCGQRKGGDGCHRLCPHLITGRLKFQICRKHGIYEL